MGQICLAENESHIYPNMCAKFGCGPTVVSKGGGVQIDRQRETASLYSRSALTRRYNTVFCPGFQKGRVPSEKGTFSAVNGPSKGHH